MWTYVVAINTAHEPVELADALPLEGERSVLDWRTGAVVSTDRLTVTLAPRDWAYWVVAPEGRGADEGDLTKYVTITAA